jgi:SAM-dependent methyltransferase
MSEETAPPAESLVAVCCPVCGGDRHRLLLRKLAHFYRQGRAHEHLFRIVRCRECGMDYVNPRLRGDLLTRHYAEHDLYLDLRGSQLEARRAYFRQTLDSIEAEQRRAGLAAGKGRLLDVACSEGTFVALAREDGWRAEGIEISAPSAAHGRDVLKLPIRTGTLEEASYDTASFDVITVQSFLEHSEEPRRLLAEIHRVLAPGGLLYANVCNGRSLAARLEKADWYNYDPVVHLSYFSPATLGRLARDAGFHSRRIRSRGVGARFFQTAVADTGASRKLDRWYQNEGYRNPLLIRVKRSASALLSAAGLGQTVILLARKEP